jgi:hypothetical protein
MNLEYNQQSFSGGMNLLGEDTRIGDNQYRVAFNITNRLDQLSLVKGSILDEKLQDGLKQGLTTFGNYLIAFVAGSAFYRAYNETKWFRISNFSMSKTTLHYWFIYIPVTTTNYVRYAAVNSFTKSADSSGAIQSSATTKNIGSSYGLLVQDNIQQPLFIYINNNGIPVAKVTQAYGEWSIQFTDGNNTTTVADKREYVPIGNEMVWDDGVLFIVSQDKTLIYRSVSGRPLDFAVNIPCTLADASSSYTMRPGGDATTTAYSVGVSGISCIRSISTGGLFVSASGQCFSVQKNMSNNAPKIFGEYTFIRQSLFASYVLSSRSIIDSLGDTKFVDLSGIRSFNAVSQLSNEGRNNFFSQNIATAITNITQKTDYGAAILFDNYEIYSIDTTFGPVLAKFDSINKCWVSFDNKQADGKRIKQFATMQIDVLALFAITEDNKLYQLYASNEYTEGYIRTAAMCASNTSNSIQENNDAPNTVKCQLKPINHRVILNNITETCKLSSAVFVNNNCASTKFNTKQITPAFINVLSDSLSLQDVGTQLASVVFSSDEVEQGWKSFLVLKWTNGSITNIGASFNKIDSVNTIDSNLIVDQ